MNDSSKDIGLIGLAVMGQNLALNIADHGFQISVFNRTYSKTVDFLERNPSTPTLSGHESLNDFVPFSEEAMQDYHNGPSREANGSSD